MFAIAQRLKFFLAVIILAVICFYSFSTTPNGLSYNAYTDAVLAGRLSIDPNECVHGDYSVFNGKCYMYFGIAPVITLLAPFKLLMNRSMPRGMPVLFFEIGTFLVSLAILSLFYKALGFRRKSFDFLLCSAVLGFSNLAGYFLRFSAVYEAAIVSAVFWTLLCCYFSLRFYRGEGNLGGHGGLRWILLASFSGGMAVASRYSYALAAFFILFWTVFEMSFSRLFGNEPKANRFKLGSILKNRAKIFVHFVSAFGPFSIILVVLGIMNYVRFGNFLDFGIRHQQHHFWDIKDFTFGVHNIWQNIYLLFLNYTKASIFFPYFDVFNSYYLFPFEPKCFGMMPVINPLYCAPFLIFGLACFYYPTGRAQPDGKRVRYFGFIVAIPGLINLFIILCTPTIGMRYLIDFLQFFLLLSCFGFVLLIRKIWVEGPSNRVIWGVGSVFGVFGVLSGLAWSMTGHVLRFMHEDSKTYERIEKKFDWVTDLFFRESEYGPIKMKVQFKEFAGFFEPFSKPFMEPLILTGRPNWKYNAVYVKYVRPRVVQFGIYPENRLTDEIEFDPSKTYEIEVALGSLFPSGNLGSLFNSNRLYMLMNSPFSPIPHYLRDRGMDVEVYKNYSVKVDGVVRLSGATEFFPSSADQVRIGSHPLAESVGWSKRFSGKVSDLTRIKFLSKVSQ